MCHVHISIHIFDYDLVYISFCIFLADNMYMSTLFWLLCYFDLWKSFHKVLLKFHDKKKYKTKQTHKQKQTKNKKQNKSEI